MSSETTKYITQSNHIHSLPTGWSNQSAFLSCKQGDEKILKINANMTKKTHYSKFIHEFEKINPQIPVLRNKLKSKVIPKFNKWIEQNKDESILQKRHTCYRDNFYPIKENIEGREWIVNHPSWNEKKSLIEWGKDDDKQATDNWDILNQKIGNNLLTKYTNEICNNLEQGMYPKSKIISISHIWRYASVSYSKLDETLRHFDDFFYGMIGVICEHGTYIVPNVCASGNTQMTEDDVYFFLGVNFMKDRHSFILKPGVGNIITVLCILNTEFCDKFYEKFLVKNNHIFYKLKVRLIKKKRTNVLIEYIEEDRSIIVDSKKGFKKQIMKENRKKKKNGKYKLFNRKKRKRSVMKEQLPSSIHIKHNKNENVMKNTSNKIYDSIDVMTGTKIQEPAMSPKSGVILEHNTWNKILRAANINYIDPFINKPLQPTELIIINQQNILQYSNKVRIIKNKDYEKYFEK